MKKNKKSKPIPHVSPKCTCGTMRTKENEYSGDIRRVKGRWRWICRSCLE